MPGDSPRAFRASCPGERLAAYPWQMLDDNKWLAARHGLDGELVDLPSSDRVMAEIVEATGA